MKRTHVLDEPGKWRIVWQDKYGFRERGPANMDEEMANRIADAMSKTSSGGRVTYWTEQAETPALAEQPPAEAG